MLDMLQNYLTFETKFLKPLMDKGLSREDALIRVFQDFNKAPQTLT